MDRTADFYSRPSYVQRGGAGIPVYSGSRRQRGGSILGALKSFFLPLGKSVLKKGTKQAIGLAADMAGDVFRGRNLQQSLIQHGKRRAKNLGREALAEGAKSVSALFNNSQPKTLRKRRKGAKTARQPAKKKRRTAKSLF